MLKGKKRVKEKIVELLGIGPGTFKFGMEYPSLYHLAIVFRLFLGFFWYGKFDFSSISRYYFDTPPKYPHQFLPKSIQSISQEIADQV